MNKRLKEARKALKVSQREFGRRLGVTDAAISKLESAERNLTEQMFLAICHEFNINEKWLRTGEGEMFVSEVSDDVAELVRKRNLKPIDRAIIEAYISLPEETRSAILSMAIRIANEAYRTDALPDGVSDNKAIP